MRFEQPLDDLFASRSHVRVLRALVDLPEGLAVSARELGRRAGISHPRAGEVLAELLGQGVVLVHRRLRANAYRLNEQHVMTARLRQLFGWEAELYEALLQLLRKEIPRAARGIEGAYLFGSTARRETTDRSDVDVAVIAPGRRMEDVSAELEGVEEAVRRRFGSRLDVVVSREPLARRRLRRVGRSLWQRIAVEGRELILARRSAK